MIFRPAKPKMLWDTWLFEWQGTYHMYFLETNEEIWDRIGHAISTDLVHWEARPSIAMKGAPGQWNDAPLLTGMVVRHDERFYMLVCAEFEQIQRVGVHVSDDLCNWTEHDGNPVMIPAGPHYLSEPTPPALPSVDWRDPAIVYREEDEHYHAILCGRRREQTHSDSGAVFGHMRSEDLLSWEHLPPLDAPTAGFYHTEVPDIFELDGRYYLLNSSYTVGGVRHNTTSRDDATGTYYMVSDHFEGPYSLPDDYLLLGSGGRSMEAYVGRTIPYERTRLLYHQVASEYTTWGAPKLIRTNEDGTLYLEYMPVLERLETGVVCDGGKGTLAPTPNDLGEWEHKDGSIVGTANAFASSATVDDDFADLHLSCKIDSSSAGRAGVILRGSGEPGHHGIMIALDYERGRLEIGTGSDHPLVGPGMVTCRDYCRYDLQHDTQYRLRCFVRDEHVEVYLNDRWVFTSVFAEVSNGGRVEILVSKGEASFSELRIAAIEPLF